MHTAWQPVGRNFNEGESTMDPFLITLIAVLLGAVMLAFYMDWLGLWVSKAAMKEQIAQARERMRGKPSEDQER